MANTIKAKTIRSTHTFIDSTLLFIALLQISKFKNFLNIILKELMALSIDMDRPNNLHFKLEKVEIKIMFIVMKNLIQFFYDEQEGNF